MADHGPFEMDPARYEALQQGVAALLKESRALAVIEYAGRDVVNAAGIAGATVEGRSAYSMMVQAMVNSAEEAGISTFDVIDGFGHGLGSYLAQQPLDSGKAGMKLLAMQMRGYFDRTWLALNQKPEKIDG